MRPIVLITLAGLAPTAHTQPSILNGDTVSAITRVTAGDPATGLSGESLSRLAISAVNDRGDLVYFADTDSGPGNGGFWLQRPDGDTHLIAFDERAAPYDPNTLIDSVPSRPKLNAHGDLLVSVKEAVSTGGTTVYRHAIVGLARDDTATRFLAGGDPVAGMTGYVHQSLFDWHMLGDGSAVISGRPAVHSRRSGIWSADGNRSALLAGDELPSPWDPASALDHVYGTILTTPSGDIVATGVINGESSGNKVMWRQGPSGVSLSLMRGDSFSGTLDQAVTEFTPWKINANGDVLVRGQIQNVGGAIWIDSPGNTRRLVAAASDPAPGNDGGSFGVFMAADINDQGTVAFWSTAGLSSPLLGTTGGLWSQTNDGDTTLIARNGSPVPGTPWLIGEEWFDDAAFRTVDINNRGLGAFLTQLEDDTGGEIGNAIIVFDTVTGDMRPVLYPGAVITLDGESRLIDDVMLSSFYLTENSLFSQVNLADGSEAILQITIPAPTTAIPAFGFILMLKRRR